MTDMVTSCRQETASTADSAEPEVAASGTEEPDPNDTWISDEIQAVCEEAGSAYQICPELLEAIIERESSGQQYVSNGDCIGLMQVNYRLHTERMQRLGFSDLWDIRANIYTGADLLRELCEKYGDIGIALMAYNGTSGAAERTTLTPYAQGILDRSDELQTIHGKGN